MVSELRQQQGGCTPLYPTGQDSADSSPDCDRLCRDDMRELLRQAAERYWSAGLSVIPVRGYRAPDSKSAKLPSAPGSNTNSASLPKTKWRHSTGPGLRCCAVAAQAASWWWTLT